MKTFIILAASLAATGPSYHLDLSRYFPTPAAEQTDRTKVLADADTFMKRPASSLDAPEALSRWLADYDSLSRRINRHDTYVYLRAEEDTDDRTDAAADEALSVTNDRLDAAVQNTLSGIGAGTLQGFLAADPTLARYGYFIRSALAKAAHTRPAVQANALLTTPALDSLSASYSNLRRKALASIPAVKPTTGKDAFDAKWQPYLENEDAFAALLVPIVSLHNGEGKLEGFKDGVEARYFHLSLTAAEVDPMVAAVRKSDANARYIAVVAAAAATKLHVAPGSLHI